MLLFAFYWQIYIKTYYFHDLIREREKKSSQFRVFNDVFREETFKKMSIFHFSGCVGKRRKKQINRHI